MQSCPFCGGVVAERGLFCGSCAKQVRCKECRDILEANARACISCGTLIGEGGVTGGTSSPSLTMNTLTVRETTRSRTVEVSFSDTAVVNLGDILGYVGNKGIAKRPPFTHASSPTDISRLLPPRADGLDSGEGDESDETVKQSAAQPGSTTASETDRDRLRQVFFHDGERLVLDNLHLKATAQLDAARRLVYLFLYAHELEGRQEVAREQINVVLKDVGLYEPNIVNWISTSSDLRESTESEQPMFRLRMTGREEAKKILEQVLNPNIPDEWVLSDRSRARGKGSSETAGGDKAKAAGRSGRKKSLEPELWAQKWTDLNFGVDGHSIVDAATGLNKGLFGLWAIRKATGDSVKVVSKTKLGSFLHKAFVVKVAPSTLRTALESKNAKGKVIRVKGGYEITPTGMSEAQSLAELNKSDATSSKATGKKKP